MLNLELARIVVAERQRAMSGQLREGRFRRDIAERRATLAGSSLVRPDSSAQPCQDAGQQPKPALG
jgi:hypothetical protein